ncbi:MAG TPA: hypothetical protein VF937_04880 [Chloroflexota bacterium]
MRMLFNRNLLRLPIALAIVVGLMAVPASPGMAGSSHVGFNFVALPPALTFSDTTTRYGLLKGVLTTFNTTATHVLLTVTVNASQAINLAPNTTGCTATSAPQSGGVTTTFSCAAPNVNPNSTQIIPIEFVSPASLTSCGTPCSLAFAATLTFAEGNTNQGSDTLACCTPPATIQFFSSASQTAADGNCLTFTPGTTATLGTQASATVNQGTQVTFGTAAGPVPCTAGATGVDPQIAPTPLHTAVSFVSLPTLAQPATVNVTFYNLPSGTNANKFVLYELVNYAFGSSVSSQTTSFAVPACQNGAIPIGFDSCVLAQSNYGHSGVVVTLLTLPSGDPGYSG